MVRLSVLLLFTVDPNGAFRFNRPLFYFVVDLTYHIHCRRRVVHRDTIMKDYRYLRFILTGLLTLGIGLSPVLAQEPEVAMEGTLADSIVVTANRLEVGERQTGRRVAVWTTEDIEALPVSSFDELLRTVGGVEIQSRGGFGVQSDLSIRGSTFNGVLVLLDGVPINDPMTQHFMADLPVPLSEIARIEVLRGPASTLYGPDALGGVVQIFTRTGLVRLQEDTGLGGQVGVDGGSYGMRGVDGSASYRMKKSVINAATGYRHVDGMPITGSDGEPIESSEGPVRTDFTRQAHTVAQATRIGSALLYTRAGYDSRDFSAFHYYTPFASDTAREATSTYWAHARLGSGRQGVTRWRFDAAGKQHDDEYRYNPQTGASRHTSRKLRGQFQLSHYLSPTATIIGGLSGTVRSIESNTLGEHVDRSAGVYVMGRWTPVNRLYLNASSRLDYDPIYGIEPTPQLSAAYNFSRVTLRANVGRAVRAPNYVERFISAGGNQGNPDLVAEKAWSYEAGIDLRFPKGIEVHTTGFVRHTDDLIDYVRVDPSVTVFTARNLLQVGTRGFEVEGQIRRRLTDTRQLRFDAAYTLLDADVALDPGTPPAATYKYALTKARHLVQGSASYTIDRFTAGVQGLWKQRMRTVPSHVGGPSYSVINLRAAYRLPLGAQQVVISGEMRNLFDVEYTEIFDAPMPGRWGIVRVRLDL
jgi:iron complex outermembrane receptor protein